jgi:type IV secretion system protein VirD4
VGAVTAVGPSRSGKTRTVVEAILEGRGPALLFSVKTDLLAKTIDHRRQLGEVKVFDPSGVSGEQSASWTPLRDAGHVKGAQAAAKALSDASPRGEHENSSYWLKQAEILLSGILWLAATAPGRSMGDVVAWVMAQDQPREGNGGTIAPLLRALIDGPDPAVAEGARQAHTWLRGIWEMDPRTSSSIYATARTAIWPWADPGVAAVSKCCEIDLPWLLSGENTLYICAPLADQDRLAPTLGGLVGDVVNQAVDLSNRRGCEPLDPTLLVVLDEAANAPLRQLPQWASTLAGIGIQLVTTWQSKSQIDAIYGAQADTILTNHRTKLFFAGMSDSSGLEYVNRLLGIEHVASDLSGSGLDSPGVPTHVPLAPPNVLRQMRPGEALLIHETLPAAHIQPVSPPRRAWPARRPSTAG